MFLPPFRAVRFKIKLFLLIRRKLFSHLGAKIVLQEQNNPGSIAASLADHRQEACVEK
jgi:hypothetical protein